MKMVNMAMPKEKSGKSDGCCCCGPCDCGDEGKPRYPWGLQISLEKEQLDALGIKEMPVTGTVVTLQATAKVTRCSEEEREGAEPSRSISLQITDLAFEQSAAERKPVDMAATAKALYGNSMTGAGTGATE